MKLICISGLDGSGKTSLVTGLAKELSLGVLPRLSEQKKIEVSQLKESGASLRTVGSVYLDGMMEVYRSYLHRDETYVADRWVLDLLAMMQADHILNGASPVLFDYKSLSPPIAAIFLDCNADDRNKRFIREGRSVSYFDALSLQEGCQETFSKFIREKYLELGVPKSHFLRINGTYIDTDYVLEQALTFLKSSLPVQSEVAPTAQFKGSLAL